MARLVGVDLPREKRLEIALTYIYGVGRTRAQATCDGAGVSRDVRVKDLTEDDLIKSLPSPRPRTTEPGPARTVTPLRGSPPQSLDDRPRIPTSKSFTASRFRTSTE